MKQKELFEKICKDLDKLFCDAQNHPSEEMQEFYRGAYRMAEKVVSAFSNINRSIIEDDGVHRIVDYRV